MMSQMWTPVASAAITQSRSPSVTTTLFTKCPSVTPDGSKFCRRQRGNASKRSRQGRRRARIQKWRVENHTGGSREQRREPCGICYWWSARAGGRQEAEGTHLGGDETHGTGGGRGVLHDVGVVDAPDGQRRPAVPRDDDPLPGAQRRAQDGVLGGLWGAHGRELPGVERHQAVVVPHREDGVGYAVVHEVARGGARGEGRRGHRPARGPVGEAAVVTGQDEAPLGVDAGRHDGVLAAAPEDAAEGGAGSGRVRDRGLTCLGAERERETERDFMCLWAERE